MSAVGFVQVPGDKRQFVAGLSWKVEDRNPSAKRVRALAADRGRWACRRRTVNGGFQVGFCEIPSPAKKGGFTSLAAAIADARREPWLGIFQVSEDLFWYIAVRDNQSILPDGDLLGSADDIRDARAAHASLGDWNFVDGDVGTLAEMLADRKGNWPIVDSRHRPWLKPTIAATCVLVVGGGGVLAFKKHERDVLIQQQMAQQQRMALAAALAAKQPKPAPVLPWTQLASSTDFFSACQAAFSRTPLSQVGWVLTRVEFDQSPGGSVVQKTVWQRAGGTDVMTPQGVLSNDGDSVQDSTTIATGLPLFSGDALETGDALRRAVRSVGQALGFPMQLSLSSPPPAQPNPPANSRSGNHPPPPPPWLQGQASMKMPASPWAMGLGAVLDRIPGLRITSVVWDGQDWAISGPVYSANAIHFSMGPQETGPHLVAPPSPVPASNPSGVVHVE